MSKMDTGITCQNPLGFVNNATETSQPEMVSPSNRRSAIPGYSIEDLYPTRNRGESYYNANSRYPWDDQQYPMDAQLMDLEAQLNDLGGFYNREVLNSYEQETKKDFSLVESISDVEKVPESPEDNASGQAAPILNSGGPATKETGSDINGAQGVGYVDQTNTSEGMIEQGEGTIEVPKSNLSENETIALPLEVPSSDQLDFESRETTSQAGGELEGENENPVTPTPSIWSKDPENIINERGISTPFVRGTNPNANQTPVAEHNTDFQDATVNGGKKDILEKRDKEYAATSVEFHDYKPLRPIPWSKLTSRNTNFIQKQAATSIRSRNRRIPVLPRISRTTVQIFLAFLYLLTQRDWAAAYPECLEDKMTFWQRVLQRLEYPNPIRNFLNKKAFLKGLDTEMMEVVRQDYWEYTATSLENDWHPDLFEDYDEEHPDFNDVTVPFIVWHIQEDLELEAFIDLVVGKTEREKERDALMVAKDMEPDDLSDAERALLSLVTDPQDELVAEIKNLQGRVAEEVRKISESSAEDENQLLEMTEEEFVDQYTYFLPLSKKEMEKIERDEAKRNALMGKDILKDAAAEDQRDSATLTPPIPTISHVSEGTSRNESHYVVPTAPMLSPSSAKIGFVPKKIMKAEELVPASVRIRARQLERIQERKRIRKQRKLRKQQRIREQLSTGGVDPEDLSDEDAQSDSDEDSTSTEESTKQDPSFDERQGLDVQVGDGDGDVPGSEHSDHESVANSQDAHTEESEEMQEGQKVEDVGAIPMELDQDEEDEAHSLSSENIIQEDTVTEQDINITETFYSGEEDEEEQEEENSSDGASESEAEQPGTPLSQQQNVDQPPTSQEVYTMPTPSKSPSPNTTSPPAFITTPEGSALQTQAKAPAEPSTSIYDQPPPKLIPKLILKFSRKPEPESQEQTPPLPPPQSQSPAVPETQDEVTTEMSEYDEAVAKPVSRKRRRSKNDDLAKFIVPDDESEYEDDGEDSEPEEEVKRKRRRRTLQQGRRRREGSDESS